MAEVARSLLLYWVFPLWVAAGLLDCMCHRRAVAGRTVGLNEDLLQLLMTAEVGLAMLVVALLEINAAVLLTVLVVFTVHQLTVCWELHCAPALRRVYPFEQMVHVLLEVLPLLSLALLAAAQWEQARALFGIGPALPDFSLRARTDPWPPVLLAGGLLGALLLNGLPLLEESWRGWKARRFDLPNARIRPSPGPR